VQVGRPHLDGHHVQLAAEEARQRDLQLRIGKEEDALPRESRAIALEGAARETWEEAGARIEVGGLYTLFNLPHINQVYFMFRARLLDLDFQPGTESLETKLFAEAEIPWNEIAFRTVRATLEQYFNDRRAGSFDFHFGDIRTR